MGLLILTKEEVIMDTHEESIKVIEEYFASITDEQLEKEYLAIKTGSGQSIHDFLNRCKTSKPIKGE